MNSPLKTGTAVTWPTHPGGQGRTTMKRGEIVCIVPAGTQPFIVKRDQKHYILPDGQEILCSQTQCGEERARREVSYIVRVGANYYWPRTSLLLKFSDIK